MEVLNLPRLDAMCLNAVRLGKVPPRRGSQL